MNSSIISIIVPCYNIEKYLSKCIEHVVNQTYPYWELILVDDGSPDDTGKLCDEYAAKDNRIKVIHKKNGGLVSARNAGYDIATGEWIMYVDGDDWIDTDTCEKIMQFVSQNQDVDIVFWKYSVELENKSIKGKCEWPCEDKSRLYVGDECQGLARNTLVYKLGIATACCKMIRTEYAKRFNLRHDDRLKQGAEGLEFSLRAFYYAKKALFINTYSYHYFFNSNSISKKIDEKNTQYLIDSFNIIQEDLENFENKEFFTEALYQRVVYVIIAIAMSTYFHPANEDSLMVKIRKYKAVIKNNELFQTSLRKCCTEGMDIQRKITLLFIRCRMYFMLHFIAKVKQMMLKRGKYNY